MEFRQTDLRQFWLQRHVRRVACKPGPRDAVLNDIESFHHHAGALGANTWIGRTTPQLRVIDAAVPERV